jgi:hypothetical protein
MSTTLVARCGHNNWQRSFVAACYSSRVGVGYCDDLRGKAALLPLCLLYSGPCLQGHTNDLLAAAGDESVNEPFWGEAGNVYEQTRLRCAGILRRRSSRFPTRKPPFCSSFAVVSFLPASNMAYTHPNMRAVLRNGLIHAHAGCRFRWVVPPGHAKMRRVPPRHN